MSAPTAHLLAGIAFYTVTTPTFEPRKDWKLILTYCGISILPDLDFLPVFFVGFERANNLHHTYSHSILFALLAAAIFGTLWWRIKGYSWRSKVSTVLALLGLHLAVDYFTKDTRPPIGSRWLLPFSARLFNSPISIFRGVAKKDLSSIFSGYNLFSMTVDVAVFGIIIVAIMLVRGFLPVNCYRRLKRD